MNNRQVRYNGLNQCWFTEDGDMLQQREENAVLGTWTEWGYKPDEVGEVFDEWLAHWSIDSDGCIERANPAAVLGRKGGSVTSKAKKKSSANNGKLGGRPRKNKKQ